jgi:hypothetical protein
MTIAKIASLLGIVVVTAAPAMAPAAALHPLDNIVPKASFDMGQTMNGGDR